MTWRQRALGVYLLIIAVALLIIGSAEVDTQKRLGPVGVVGPCREFGPDNIECRRQSRRIIRSCLTHRDCLDLVFRLTDRAENQGIIKDQRSRDDMTQGGDAQQSEPSAPQQPSPGDGADTGAPPPPQPPGDDGPNPPTPPPTQPPPPEQPGLLDPVTQPVCELTNVCL